MIVQLQFSRDSERKKHSSAGTGIFTSHLHLLARLYVPYRKLLNADLATFCSQYSGSF